MFNDGPSPLNASDKWMKVDMHKHNEVLNKIHNPDLIEGQNTAEELGGGEYQGQIHGWSRV
jgi:hypothetical protein